MKINTITKAPKTLTLLVSLLATAASPHVLADKRQSLQDAKGGLTFFSAAIAGGIAGGPIGFILGGLGGAYWAEQGQQKLDQETQLERSHMNVSKLEKSVDDQSLEIAKLEAMIAEKMQFQMYFKTGDAQLTQSDETQVEALADFLAENDYMHVTIDGHADPRGEANYNITLSESRAESVAKILKEAGIEDYRLQVKGHGARFSSAALSSVEEYAEQRRVKIQVFPSKGSAGLASLD